MPKKRVSHEEGSGIPLTSEHMVYLQCWLKAKERGSITFVRETEKEAKTLSYALYRTAKIILSRPDLQAEFPQFQAARLDVSIRVEGNKLIMFRSDQNPLTKQIIEELGLSEADIQLPKMESVKHGESRISAALRGEPEEAEGKAEEPLAFSTYNPLLDVRDPTEPMKVESAGDIAKAGSGLGSILQDMVKHD